jgi:hypothetical protein
MDENQKRSLVVTGIAIVIVLVLLGAAFFYNSKPGTYDQFAICLKQKDLKFYGAFWCPHCAAQKAEFGNSVKYLPYVECSTPDGQGTLPVCKTAGIQGFPTWVYPDGTRTEGVQTLQQLSQKSGCSLPTGADQSSSETASGTGESSAAK